MCTISFSNGVVTEGVLLNKVMLDNTFTDKPHTNMTINFFMYQFLDTPIEKVVRPSILTQHMPITGPN